MQWQVTGADRQTGIEAAVLVEADDEESAIRRAGRQGMLVSTAVLVTVDSVDAVPEDELAPATVAYETPGEYPLATLVPDYPALQRGARLMNGLGLVLIALAVACLGLFLFGQIMAFQSGPRALRAFNFGAGVPLLGAAVALFAVGVLWQTIASIALAVRDIARNSFRP